MKINNFEFPRNKRGLALVLSLVLVLSAIGGTVAFLATRSGEVENTFTPAPVAIEIIEETSGKAKTSIVVENTGDAYVYIRVALVANKLEKGAYIPDSLVLNPELGDGWVKGKDGYYYYTISVAKDTYTPNLLADGENITMSANQEITVLAQAIQADGEGANGKPVIQAWGAANGGSVKEVGKNGVLTIDED